MSRQGSLWAGVVCVALLFGGGTARAEMGPDSLPCNSLCRAWMGQPKADAPLDVTGPGAVVAPATTARAAPVEAATPPLPVPRAIDAMKVEGAAKKVEAVKRAKLNAPIPMPPTQGAPLDDGMVDLGLAWSSPSEARLKYFVEVRVLENGAYREVFSGAAVDPKINVKLKRGHAYAWRVFALSANAKGYVKTAWQTFTVRGAAPISLGRLGGDGR